MRRIAFLFVALVALSAWANADLLTFSEYPVGTIVTNQYAGIIFGNNPIIANDGANPTSPVLSPNPPYAGVFTMDFTGGGATGVQFDSGYWNNQNGGTVLVYGPDDLTLLATLNNGTFGLYPDPAGLFHFDLSGYGAIGFILFDSTADDAGGAIDNLQYNSVPEPASLVLMGTGLLALARKLRK